jgi:hypothetical protein
MMGTTKEDIGQWFDDDHVRRALRRALVCDTFDHEDYPVYVKAGEDVREKYEEYSGKEMQRVMDAARDGGVLASSVEGGAARRAPRVPFRLSLDAPCARTTL